MAPTSARIRLAGLAVIGAVAAGCTSAPEPATGVSDGTVVPAPTSTAPAQDDPFAREDDPSGQVGTVPAPPDLSGNTIDCDAVDGPCDHGDDAELDELWDACAGGAGGACDRLYYDSGFDTRYEQFGNTCGDRDVTVPCPRDLAPSS